MTTAPRSGSLPVALPAVASAAVAAWILWRGVEFPVPGGLALMAAGVAGWLAAVASVWFGPLPDGRSPDLVGAAITGSALATAAVALGALVLVAELA